MLTLVLQFLLKSNAYFSVAYADFSILNKVSAKVTNFSAQKNQAYVSTEY